MLVVGNHEGLRGWDLVTGQLGWDRPLALGAQVLYAHHDGATFFACSSSGEVSQRLFDDGSVVQRISLNERLRNLVVSQDCGLSDAVLDAIELAGGRIVENSTPGAEL